VAKSFQNRSKVEAKILQKMQGFGKFFILLIKRNIEGIPKLLYHGTEGDYHVIVMELLGPNLDDLMSYCDGGLSLKSVIMIIE
jgi:hypothetical protein